MSSTQNNAALTPLTEDAEIEQIMNEIEELQKTMGTSDTKTNLIVVEDPVKTETPEPKIFASEGAPALTQAPMEETLSQLAPVHPENEDGPIGSGNLPEEDTFMKTLEPNNNAPAGSVSLSLKGNMALKLSYECQGNEVTISFSEGVLNLSLPGGGEFKIPLTGENKHLKAA